MVALLALASSLPALAGIITASPLRPAPEFHSTRRLACTALHRMPPAPLSPTTHAPPRPSADLKPQNVLLKTQRADYRGFVCKLADFGLSRLLGEQQTHIDTGSCGTTTYAAPELLVEGRLTRACDVYSFGILMWSLVAGVSPFQGMPPVQVRRACMHCKPRPAEVPAAAFVQ